MQGDQSSAGCGHAKKTPISAPPLHASTSGRRSVLLVFLVVAIGFFVFAHQSINDALMTDTSSTATKISATTSKQQNQMIPSTDHTSQTPQTPKQAQNPPPPRLPPQPTLIPFTCPVRNANTTYVCHSPSSPTTNTLTSSPSCPDYFRWIHEDLRPWKTTGITREMLERARRTANFRLVILNGRLYIEKYRQAFQTRDVFTLWGILQLLRRYPGRVPDIELMFDCVDWPVVKTAYYRGEGRPAPPPLFRYCADGSTLDIVFPDWSFWGWPEINIKPWEALLKELNRGNKRMKWMDRQPYAYWKGNPAVATTRQELLKCNVSDAQDWNARIFAQDWLRETEKGFKESDLASQCNYRYKIYIEGTAWSVSEKYILACNSMSLLVTPRYHDFFTRGLIPVHHYWPIRADDKCNSIRFAVDWGNSHKQKAQAIGNEASTFIREQLKMDYVYDYMFHLLSEYAKLLKFKPSKPHGAVELCAESMACPAEGLERKFMMESMVTAPHDSGPCSMPPAYSPVELKLLKRRKENSIKQVEMWEQKATEGKNN